MPNAADNARMPSEVVDWVERMHDVVDELVAPIVLGHGARLRCGEGCNDCCSDGLTVFALEAAVIERHHAGLLASETPHAEGACAFLDEAGACRIYAHRPYVCRTQGLPLRWLEHDEEGRVTHTTRPPEDRSGPVEVRDICPLNAEGPPLDELTADECWTLGPFEERLGARQVLLDGGAATRVALRSLFAGGRRRLPVVR